MRGSVGSNINRRKLAAKYKKKTPSTESPKTGAVAPVSTVVSRQGRSTVSQRTTVPQRTPVEDTRPDKVVPAATSVDAQGIVTGKLNLSQTKPATVSRDFGDKVISSELDEDGNRTGKWDANKDLAGMSNIEKWWEGIKSPYEQPAQMIKNVSEEIRPENQMVKDTALDLAINPIIETFAGAKNLGITQKDFYWPDQLTGIDHPSMPDFLRTGGGSGSDIIGGIANNLGYLQDVVTSPKAAAAIGAGYEDSGQRFMDQPAYYVGSAIGEVPMWLIGVGPAKAAITVSSKAAMVSIKTAAATGKLPGPKVIKKIVETEMNHSRLTKVVEESIRKDNAGINNILPRSFNKIVQQSIKLVKTDLDVKKIAEIKEQGHKVKELKRESSLEASQLNKLRSQYKNNKTSVGPNTKAVNDIKIKIKEKRLKIKNLEKQINLNQNSIKKKTQKLDSVKLENEFKLLSKDKSRQGQRDLLQWVVQKQEKSSRTGRVKKQDGLQARVQQKFEELPNQVKILKATRLKFLESKRNEILAKSKKITGKDSVGESFWELPKKGRSTDDAIPSGVTPKEKIKLMKLRKSYMKITDDIIQTSDNDYVPWAETIRKIERTPGAISGKWDNLVGTKATSMGDQGILLKEKIHTGFSGQLRKIYDYHAENVSLARSKEVNYWSDLVGDSFAGLGHVSRSEMDTYNKKLSDTKTNILQDREKIAKEIDTLEEGKIDSKTEVEIKSLNKELDTLEQALIDVDDYNFKQFSSKIPGKGTTGELFFFEPVFLKKYLTPESYSDIIPKEITYVTRPTVTVEKKQGRLFGRITSDAVGEQMEFIVQRRPVEPSKSRAVRYAKKFKPRGPKSMRIRDRYMTTANSQMMMIQRKRNPFGDDIIRVPKNAPESLKHQLTNAYARKFNPEKDSRMLLGMTGGENYDLYKLIKITDEQRFANKQINVGDPANIANKDSELDRLRSVNEIENTRAYLRGDSEDLNASLDVVTTNLSKFDEDLTELAKRQGTDSDTNPALTKTKIKEIKAFQAAEFKRKDELTSMITNVEDQNTRFAKSGVSFGFQRGAVSVIDTNILNPKTNTPIGWTPMVKNKKTGKIIMFREGDGGEMKMYELDNMEVYGKIRPDDVQFGRKTPDDMLGIMEDLDENVKAVSVSRQPDDMPLAESLTGSSKNFKMFTINDKDQFVELGKSTEGSKGGTKAVSENILESYTIRLGNVTEKGKNFGKPLETPEALASKGIRELTPEEINEFDIGSLFSSEISNIKSRLGKTVDKTTVEGAAGTPQTVSKSRKTQFSNIIDAGVSRFSISTLSKTSNKIRNIRNALKGEEWEPVRITSKAVSEDSLRYTTNVQKGTYELGTDSLSPLARAILQDDSPRLFGIGEDSTTAAFSSAKLDDYTRSISGLNVFNVIDIGVVGGRTKPELTNLSVARETSNRMYKKYRESTSDKNKYQELLFAAKTIKGEEVFRMKLVNAYKDMKHKESGQTGNRKKLTHDEMKAIIGKNIDPATKEVTFKSTAYDKIINDIVKNDRLREVTVKDRLRIATRGRRPTQKAIEQKSGVISIKYNFNKLGDLLPDHSLIGRVRTQSVAKLQGTDDFLSSAENLLGGFTSQVKRRFWSPKFSTTIQEDMYVKEGFLQAVEFARSKGVKITRQDKREYDKIKGSHDSFNDEIERVELSGNIYGENVDNVLGTHGTGSYIQDILSPEETIKLEQVKNKIKTLHFGDDNALRNLDIKIRVKNEDGTWVQRNVMDDSYYVKFDKENGGTKAKQEHILKQKRTSAELRRMEKQLKKLKRDKNPRKKDIAEKETEIRQQEDLLRRQKHKTKRWDKIHNKKIRYVSEDARSNRLKNAEIEFALEKSYIERISIDAGEYKNYAHYRDKLYREKADILEESGSYEDLGPLERSQIDKIHSNINFLNERQGKPVNVSLDPKKQTYDSQTDFFYTIQQKDKKTGKLIFKKQVGSFSGESVGDEILKTFEDSGYLNMAPSYEKTTAWTPQKRIGAFDEIRDLLKRPTQNTEEGIDQQSIDFFKSEGFEVTTPDNKFNNINVIEKNGVTKYYHDLPVKLNEKIDTVDKWHKASADTKHAIYRDDGWDVRTDMTPVVFHANRMNRNVINKEGTRQSRSKLIRDPFAKNTLEQLEKFRKRDVYYDKKSGADPTGEALNKMEGDRLSLLVKPPTDYDSKLNIYISVGGKSKLSEKQLNTSDWQRTNIHESVATPASTKEMRILLSKTRFLERMGIDKNAYKDQSSLLNLFQRKENSKNTIKINLGRLSSKSSSTRSKAASVIEREKKSSAVYDEQIKAYQEAIQTQKASTTLRSTRPVNIGKEQTKFLSFGPGDLAPNYREQSQGSNIPAAYAATMPLGVSVTPQTQPTKLATPSESASESKTQSSVKSQTQQPDMNVMMDITSGMDMSLPGLLKNVQFSSTSTGLQSSQANRLDANLGWLSAQLPAQITRPMTRMDAVTAVTGAMKIGTKLRTSSIIKLSESFRLQTAMASSGTLKKKPVDFTTTSQRYRTQSIVPVFLGPTWWEKSEERARKRKKKPKRKSAKTWWQTPENWYESNYWGKSGTGSGYVTFKGSEPKRLKDRKNQFGF